MLYLWFRKAAATNHSCDTDQFKQSLNKSICLITTSTCRTSSAPTACSEASDFSGKASNPGSCREFLQLGRKQIHPPETPTSSNYVTIRHALRQQERQTLRCFHCYYTQQGDNLEHSPAAEGKPVWRTSSQNLGNVTFGHLFPWLNATALFSTPVLRCTTRQLNKSWLGTQICYLRQHLWGTV